MRIAIIVFKKDWVEAKPLFSFLEAFDVKIIHQDSYGDRMHEIKGDYLLVEGGVARWANLEDFQEFLKEEFCSIIHYDSLIYNIKNN